MSDFGQYTRLSAAPGKREQLVWKFIEAAELQQSNADCKLMLVGTVPGAPDAVYLIEVWSSEDAWEAARSSPAIQHWAESMPPLVAGSPASTRLEIVGGKGPISM